MKQRNDRRESFAPVARACESFRTIPEPIRTMRRCIVLELSRGRVSALHRVVGFRSFDLRLDDVPLNQLL